MILTWIQKDSNLLIGTGAPGAASNSRVKMMRWDSATAMWGAASTLIANLANELSDSLAAAGIEEDEPVDRPAWLPTLPLLACQGDVVPALFRGVQRFFYSSSRGSRAGATGR